MKQNGKPSILYSIRIAAIAALGGFLFGFDMAVINGVIVALRNKFATGAWETGFAVSIALIGAALGALFARQPIERFGRVKCMSFAAVLVFIGSFALGISNDFYIFFVWRFICGVGIGIISITIPGYIAEIAPSDWRGRLGSFQQLAIVTGIFVGTISSYLLAAQAGGAEQKLWLGFETWRWIFWSACVPAFIYFFAALTLPESPRFLVAKDKIPQAEKTLKRIISAEKVQAKIEDIRKTVLPGSTQRISELFGKTPRGKTRLYPAVLLGVSIAALQQLTGVNTILYYGNTLWQSVGFREDQSLTLSIFISIINIFTTFSAICLIDKKGRKPLLLAGSAGMFTMLVIMAIVFATAPLDNNSNPILSGATAYITVISACLYIMLFGVTWGPVTLVMLGEMFNNRMRNAALTVAGLVQWLTNFVVVTSFLPLRNTMGYSGTYGIYAFFTLFAFFFVFNKVQETKGKELEDM